MNLNFSFAGRSRFFRFDIAAKQRASHFAASLWVCSILFPTFAAARSPTDVSIAAGSATIGQTAKTTVITQTTERAIIDWRSFNVGRDHAVTFAQPDRSSATLNRVYSFDASVIQGTITAPGTVVIQNTAGVPCCNQQCREYGPDRRLHGHDGDTTAIDVAGDGLFHIAVSGDPVSGRVTHSGTLGASGGRVLITAGGASGLLDSVINTAGNVHATSGTRAGRQVQLLERDVGQVQIAGRVDAQGAGDGGTIRISGEAVNVSCLLGRRRRNVGWRRVHRWWRAGLR